MNKTIFSTSFLAAVVMLAAIGALTYGCTQNNERYYQMAQECTSHGGSWIPLRGDNGSTALCLVNNRVEHLGQQ